MRKKKVYEDSAAVTQLIKPANEDRVGGGFYIDEFEAHTDPGLNDADQGECLDGLAFAPQRDAGAGFQSQRLARADETAA